ncbi:hypothetical protein MUK42_24944 [Musa troglodytarum]|uniref:Uncharacterized protein n=1 Tax=Musa troglodytarum TaxID=320322 RepID=A0A9E7I319_9LILI|nr:hypothetical protein MUK42_24944 [Musa troglodytarum]
MESKKTSSSSASSSTSSVDEFVGRKNAKPSATTSSSSSSRPGYFSTVIPPASAVIAKDLSHSDLCWTLNKQRGEGRIASARCANAAGSQSHGSPSRKQITQNKEGKPVYPIESIESPCFGSSVHYGARDFYTSSSSTHTSGTWKNFIIDEGNDSANPHAADRGEWWQGMFALLLKIQDRYIVV